MLKHAWFSFPMHNLVFIFFSSFRAWNCLLSNKFPKTQAHYCSVIHATCQGLTLFGEGILVAITVNDGACRGRNDRIVLTSVSQPFGWGWLVSGFSSILIQP